MSTTTTFETHANATKPVDTQLYPLNTPEGKVYVKHPVQVGAVWLAGNVTSVGYSIPLEGVSFATERDCQAFCDAVNRSHFTKEDIDNIIRASMVAGIRAKNPVIMARDVADILFGTSGMFPGLLDKQQKNRVENVFYAILKGFHEAGSDVEMENSLLRQRMNTVREKLAGVSLGNPHSRTLVAEMFETLKPRI